MMFFELAISSASDRLGSLIQLMEVLSVKFSFPSSMIAFHVVAVASN